MPTIPDQTNIVARLRPNYPTPIGNTAPLLREVATAIGLGAGLLHKPSGHHVIDSASADVRYPKGWPIASDIICFPDGHHYDVLVDADGVGAPAWQDKGFVDPSRYIAVTSAPPPPVPVPQPEPAPDETLALLRVLNSKLDRVLAVFRNA